MIIATTMVHYKDLHLPNGIFLRQYSDCHSFGQVYISSQRHKCHVSCLKHDSSLKICSWSKSGILVVGHHFINRPDIKVFIRIICVWPFFLFYPNNCPMTLKSIPVTNIEHICSSFFFGPILDDRLKKKFLKAWKGVLCIHFRVRLSVWGLFIHYSLFMLTTFVPANTLDCNYLQIIIHGRLFTPALAHSYNTSLISGNVQRLHHYFATFYPLFPSP